MNLTTAQKTVRVAFHRAPAEISTSLPDPFGHIKAFAEGYTNDLQPTEVLEFKRLPKSLELTEALKALADDAMQKFYPPSAYQPTISKLRESKLDELADEILESAKVSTDLAWDIFERGVGTHDYPELLAGMSSADRAASLVEFIASDVRLSELAQKEVIGKVNQRIEEGTYEPDKAAGIPKQLLKYAAKIYHRKFNTDGDWREVFGSKVLHEAAGMLIEAVAGLANHQLT